MHYILIVLLVSMTTSAHPSLGQAEALLALTLGFNYYITIQLQITFLQVIVIQRQSREPQATRRHKYKMSSFKSWPQVSSQPPWVVVWARPKIALI